jgi:hypothetical protein
LLAGVEDDPESDFGAGGAASAVASAGVAPASDVFEPPSPVPDFALPSSVAGFEDLAALDVARRSIFAQPEPLNTTVGAAIILRTGPLPHDGQASGPSPWTPWTTSN